MRVGTHRGKWSAVSGYLEGEEQPLLRAVKEIREELGLSGNQIKPVRAGEILRVFDEENDTVWVVHPFLFEAKSKTVQLDWENTEYKWIYPNELGSYETVPKLKETFDRVRYDSQASPESLRKVMSGVEELVRDKVHGASFQGRRAVKLLLDTVNASDTRNADDLFSDLMLVSSRLRNAQPAMANVWNMTGQLLHLVDIERKNTISVEELKRVVAKLGQKVLEESEEAAEDASRNTVQILPQEGKVLTHSYSRTVFRALELGSKSGRGFEVYATESYPGNEGKQLANDLVALGVPVKLIADSAVNSIMPRLKLVLVGADSVLRNGSLIHKVGTRNIAIEAKNHGIPVCSACETTKFNVSNFLGYPSKIAENIFDVTPAEYLSKFITEHGQVETVNVEERIRKLVMEIYP